MSPVRLSLIGAVLNSHPAFERQLKHWQRMDLPESVEIIVMDDGSDPPLRDTVGVKNLRIVPTYDTRPWTWAVARNAGAKLARSQKYLMFDLDIIFPRATILHCLESDYDKVQFIRQFGVLDEDGIVHQDTPTLVDYGLTAERIATKGLGLGPHSNVFSLKADKYWLLKGYREDLIGRPYPQGEDRDFRTRLGRLVEKGQISVDPFRPLILMFPNGKYCGDLDADPKGLFHTLSRKVAEGA